MMKYRSGRTGCRVCPQQREVCEMDGWSFQSQRSLSQAGTPKTAGPSPQKDTTNRWKRSPKSASVLETDDNQQVWSPPDGGGCFHFGFLLPFPRLILLPRQSPTLIYSSSLRFIPFPSLLRFLPTSSSQRLFPVSLNDGFLKAFISYLISFLLMLFSFLFFFTLFLSLSRWVVYENETCKVKVCDQISASVSPHWRLDSETSALMWCKSFKVKVKKLQVNKKIEI